MEEPGMDASTRGTEVSVRPRRAPAGPGPVGQLILGRDHQREAEAAGLAPAPLAGLRVALVHDWLTGMRGGEKCLEVLCQSFPRARLYTLIHRRGSLSPAIEAMAIETSLLQRVPGVFRYYRHMLPFMPLAVRGFRLRDVDLVISLSHCVAKAVVPPAGVPHVCYCFTPMRYAWHGREAYLESWSDRPLRRALARSMLARLRRWDRATASRVTHFIAISETVRQRIARCYRRDSRVIQPPVNVAFYSPAATEKPRDQEYLVVSALVPYKRIDQAVAACTQTGRRLVVIGDGPERSRLAAMAGPSVRLLGWQPDEVIRDHYRRCRALLFPGEEDFGIVPIEALACGAPVIALGRGGAAETIDNAVGCTYAEPTPAGLRAAIEGWEAAGRPHDPLEARRRALALALPVFRARLHTLLAEVVTPGGRHPMPPAPHLKDLSRLDAGE
jgi:glycosyltransferase involved in cell wall biosynthesis